MAFRLGASTEVTSLCISVWIWCHSRRRLSRRFDLFCYYRPENCYSVFEFCSTVGKDCPGGWIWCHSGIRLSRRLDIGFLIFVVLFGVFNCFWFRLVVSLLVIGAVCAFSKIFAVRTRRKNTDNTPSSTSTRGLHTLEVA